MNWTFELLLQRFNVFLKNNNTIYHAFEAFMMIRGFVFFFLRLVGGPPTTTTGRGPQAAAYLCLYVKTASALRWVSTRRSKVFITTEVRATGL